MQRAKLSGTVRVVGIVLVLVVSVGAIIDAMVHYLYLRRDFAERECAEEFEGWCWREMPGTIHGIGRCHDGSCRVTVAAWPGRRPFLAEVWVDEGAVGILRAGDPITMRVGSGGVMLVRTFGGQVLNRWDTPDRSLRSGAIILAIFGPLGIAAGLGTVRAVRRAGRRAHAKWHPPSVPVSWAVYILRILLTFGAVLVVGLPFVYVERNREARAYASAPECPDAPRDDCRFNTEARVVLIRCRKYMFCEGTFRFTGAYGTAESERSLERETAELLHHHAHVRVEVFDGSVTGIEVGGRSVAPELSPEHPVVILRNMILLAALMVVVGAVGLVRNRRRS